MKLQRLASELEAVLGAGSVWVDRPLARYTALRIGGPAQLLALAENVDALRQAVSLAWDYAVPCRVLGAGSNVLVSDAGLQGLVIIDRARAVTFRPREQPGPEVRVSVEAESGASLSTVARKCVMRGLAGLEWAATIPGTVGGAVVGNAGAWGGDIATSLLSALVLEAGGNLAKWSPERFEYGYRRSVLKVPPSPGALRPVVLAAEFSLWVGDRLALEARVAEMAARRKASQPPGASCGSVFKNPPGDHAGRLIEAAGLKGRRSGSAEISPLHANFIVNHGGATAADVVALINLARQTVREQTGVLLEPEVELVGDWQDQPIGMSSQALVPGD